MYVNPISAATTNGIAYGPAERRAYMDFLGSLRMKHTSRSDTTEPRELSALVESQRLRQSVMLEAIKIDPIEHLSNVNAMRNYIGR